MKLDRKDFFGLLALTVAAFFIHGFHPYSEDAETYLPGIEKLLHPRLFPVGSEYFELHAHLTIFPQMVAFPVRFLHLSLSWNLFLLEVVSFFLFLTACLQLMRLLFPGAAARWAGVSLVAALFTLPVAGTALYLMDPFLNPRNVIAFAVVFSVAKTIERKYLQAAAFLAFSISLHPLMSAFALSFCLLTAGIDRWPRRRSAAAQTPAEETFTAASLATLFTPFEKLFDSPTAAYDRVAANHRYQFLTRWTWYEMLGAIAPIFILEWFRSIARSRRQRHLELLCRATAIYGVIYILLGLIVSIPRRLELLSLVQPMRSFYLLYILMLLAGGGLLGDYILRNRVWRWLVLFLPLAFGMFWAQRELYPASAHIEWPWAAPRNPWVQAFLWVRNNTPEQAIFALDPYYMNADGEDSNGFRAIAQRSQLADGVKDGGVVELFPQIGDAWMAQVQAQQGIDKFSSADFERLKTQYGVSWTVLRRNAQIALDCPYRNDAVMVCRLM